MSRWLIVNARVVNEGAVIETDLRIQRGRIEQIAPALKTRAGETVIDARGRYLLPGMIDGHVHFREPGLTSKGNMATESRAAVAGGVTSYLDMPDTNPATTTRPALADKFSRAAGRSAANYSFYLGATPDNLDQISALRPDEACGVKVDMGHSTGNRRVDKAEDLAAVFRQAPGLVIAHCEDSAIIETNLNLARQRFGGQIPASAHADIRSRQACLTATRQALELAREHGTRLHVLHVSTAEETELFEPGPVNGKTITAEAGIPHLYFIDADYEELGQLLKCNPAIKTESDRQQLRRGLKSGHLDTIATSHSPHLLKEKLGNYDHAEAGLPLIQYALPAAWSLVAGRVLSPELLIEKLAHNPARRFGLVERGFVREGYWADLVLFDPHSRTEVNRQPMLSQCGWSPFAGRKLPGLVAATWVNGRLVWRDGLLTGIVPGQRLEIQNPD
jgi:dihydroorotase